MGIIKRVLFSFSILLGSAAFLLSSCSDDDPATSTVPVVSTASISEITQSSAVAGGDVTEDGGSSVVARGVCWSKTGTPTIDDSKTTDGQGLGKFTSEISGLEANTSYNVRAYATNANGTGYGNVVVFVTSEEVVEVQPATVTIAEPSDVTQTSAVFSSEITDDGGGAITARGIVWSTEEDPTTEGDKTEDGEGGGTFTSEIGELTPSTTYYVRAYAVNSAGTSYSEAITFTTADIVVPEVSTGAVTDVTDKTAVGGGEVLSDGGAEVTARGIVYAEHELPTLEDNKIESGEGLGVFTSNISGLKPKTLYHVRAYATNSVGTAYGDLVSFSTEAPPPGPALLFAGSDFEDWSVFEAINAIDPAHAANFKAANFFYQSAAGEGYDGGRALKINGFIMNTVAGTNPLMMHIAVPNDLYLEGRTKISFYIKGTSTRSITFRLYKPDGANRYKYMLANLIKGDKSEVEIPVTAGDSAGSTGANNQVGSIDTKGEWVKVIFDISNLPHGISMTPGNSFFAIRIGTATTAAGNYSYDLLLDNFMLE